MWHSPSHESHSNICGSRKKTCILLKTGYNFQHLQYTAHPPYHYPPSTLLFSPSLPPSLPPSPYLPLYTFATTGGEKLAHLSSQQSIWRPCVRTYAVAGPNTRGRTDSPDSLTISTFAHRISAFLRLNALKDVNAYFDTHKQTRSIQAYNRTVRHEFLPRTRAACFISQSFHHTYSIITHR